MKSILHRIFGKSESHPDLESAVEPRAPDLENLEGRLLFSAAPVEAPAEAATEPESVVVVEATAAHDAAAAVTETESTQEALAANSILSDQNQGPDGPADADGNQGVTLVDLNEAAAVLNQETLEAIADAAAERWRATGLTAEQSAALDNITYEVSDLGGTYLGRTEGYAITLDDDAAGTEAWFIDPTPGADEEFIQLGAGASLTGVSGTGAPGHFDLLTVVLHEQGHVLGLTDATADPSDLAYRFLGANERRLPADGQADGALPGSVPGPDYMSAAHGNFVNSGQSLGASASEDVSLGDLDGDGDLDAFVANGQYYQYGTGWVGGANAVWLNDSSGNFTDSGQVLGDSDSNAVALGDLDGDGDLDAFVANDFWDTSRVWLNDSSGNFTDSGQALGSSSSSNAVSLGDVDNDGDLDAFTANYQENTVWLNDSSGNFSDSGQTLGNSPSQDVSLGDVDGDGDLDAFVANNTTYVYGVGSTGGGNTVWLNDSSGNFTDSGQALGSSSSRGVALGDLDDDGDLDAFAVNNGGGSYGGRVWFNDSSGNFTDSGQDLSGSSVRDVSLGDLDNDGDLDAFAAGDYRVDKVWLNNSSGVFTDTFQSLGYGSYSSGASLGDLDGDGDLDAFVVNRGSDFGSGRGNEVWLNDGALVIPTAPENTGGQAVSLGDVDNDGDLDAFVANARTYISPFGFLGGENRVWLNDSSGNFTDSGQALGGSNSGDVALGDLDGDGDLDAFVANYGNSSLPNKVWLNDSSGNFTDSGQVLGDGHSYGLSLGDVDNDGDLDAFVANKYGDNKVWLNDSSGNFTDSGQALGGYYSENVSLGDLDDDGDLDAFVVNSRSGANAVWLNDSSGNFTDSGQALGASGSVDVSLGDVDDDGDLDAFVINGYDSYDGKVWLNDSSGTFTDSGQSAGMNSRDASLGDLDDDGDLDAFAVTGAVNKIWLNDSSGAFTNAFQSLGQANSVAVGLGDLDGDGDLDAFVVNDRSYEYGSGWMDGSHTVWLNDAPLVVPALPFTSNTNAVSFGDVDNDGDLDAFVANRGAYQYPFGRLAENQVWLNDSSGNFTNSGQALGGLSSYDVSLGDLDGDGDLDAFVANYGSFGRANRVWLNDSSGNFTDSGQSLGTSNSTEVSLGDVDNDGDLDAFVANSYGGNTVWLNDSSGNFTDSGQALGGYYSHATGVSLGDLDNDGDLDAFVARKYDKANTVWLNDGSGNFTDSGQALGASDSYDVSLGDVDNDGDLDAFVANSQSYQYGVGLVGGGNTVWLNDSSGNFTDSGQTLGTANSFGVSLGDLDNDGDLDAFVSNGFSYQYGGGSVGGENKIWLNDNSGNFTDSGESFAAVASFEADLGDIDDDGDLDAAIANYGTANTFWLNGPAAPAAVDLSITKDSGAVVVAQGGTVTYTVTVTGDAATTVNGAIVTDSFSEMLSNVQLTTIQLNGNTNTAAVGAVAGNQFTDTVDLAAGTSIVYTFTAEVYGSNANESAADAIVTNTATVAVPAGFTESDESNNSDGDSDIIFLDVSGGTANFADSGQLLGNSNSQGVSLGDLDNDGDLDAFIANDRTYSYGVGFTGGGNTVWFNDSSGNFTDSGQILSNADSNDLSLGDLDGDGDLDAFVGNSGANKVWLNDGSGNFTDSGQVLGSADSNGVSLGDLDGDGDLDAFVANDRSYQYPIGLVGGGNTVWLNDGSGNFTDSGQTFGNSDSREVSLGDVDGDGDLDAFVANKRNYTYPVGHSGGGNTVWLNDGSANFTDSGQVLGSSDTFGVDLGDLDGDGDLDAFVANGGGSTGGKVWLNDSSGGFTDSGQSLGGLSTRDVRLGDLDNDGDLDAFAAGYNGSAHKVWLNDSSGAFTDTHQPLGYNYGLALGLGDLDGDGDLDAFVANSYIRRENRVWFNDGALVIPAVPINPDSNALSLGDVDNDGDLDAFVATGWSYEHGFGFLSPENEVWLNDGSGHFTDSGQALGNSSSEDVSLGDLDGDGDLDAFVANSGADKVWLNDSSGNFIDSGQVLGDEYSTGVSLGDLDGDGDLDAFVTISYGDNRVWLNDSSGNFTDSGQALGGYNSRSVSLGDVDNDGDLDAFIVDARGDANTVWLNDSSGNFTDSGQALGNSDSNGVSLGDVDGDGDLDAFVAEDRAYHYPTNTYLGGGNTVWLNDSSGNFTDSGQALGASDSRGVALGDLDGDGDLDAFVANNGGSYGGKIWLNDSSGVFADSGESLPEDSTVEVALGDLDDDGDLDAAIATYGPANTFWFSQAAAPLDNSAGVDAGGNAVISADSGTDALSIRVVGGNLVIGSGGSLGGGGGTTTDAFGNVLIPLASLTTLTIDTGEGDDALVINDLTGFTGSLILDGGDGQDTITFGAGVVLDPDKNATITSEDVNFVGASIETSGTGSILIEADGGGSGNFQGVSLVGTELVASGTGSITLNGQGGDTGNYNQGVRFAGGNVISTNDGDINIGGSGGGGGGAFSSGVSLFYGTSISAGGSGDLIITGQASGLGAILSDGVFIAAGTDLSVEDGDMIIVGTGAGSRLVGRGVSLNSTLTSTGTGNISITGSSVGEGFGNVGILGSRAVIDTTAGSGSVTLVGSGSLNGTSSNSGVVLVGGRIATGGNGGIDIDGQGGGNGSGASNPGVALHQGVMVTATGDGTVNIDGTGGNGSVFNDGVAIFGVSEVSSIDGAVTIQGTGKGSLMMNRGVQLSGRVLSTGSGSVSLIGWGSDSSTGLFNMGIALNGGSKVSANTGDLTIEGHGGTGASLNDGVRIYGSTVTTNGKLTLTGSANSGTTGVANSGIYLLSSTLEGNAESVIAGTGGGGIASNHGILAFRLTSNLGGINFTGNEGAGATSRDLFGNFPL